MKKNKIVFIIYTIVLVFLILFKFSFTIEDFKNTIEQFREVDYKRVNLDFLSTLKIQIDILDRWAIVNLLGNTIPFIVYGFLFINAFKINIFNAIIINLIFVLSLELIQFIFVIGTFDIDDIFLNNLSILIGVLFGKFSLNNNHYFNTIN